MYLMLPDSDGMLPSRLVELFPPLRDGSHGQVLKVCFQGMVLWEGEPLYQAIVRQAQFLGLAVAAVLRAPLGLGVNGRLRRAALFDSIRNLSVVIEVDDTAAGIRRLLPFLDTALGEGLAAIEDAWVMRYRRDQGWSRL